MGLLILQVKAYILPSLEIEKLDTYPTNGKASKIGILGKGCKGAVFFSHHFQNIDLRPDVMKVRDMDTRRRPHSKPDHLPLKPLGLNKPLSDLPMKRKQNHQ